MKRWINILLLLTVALISIWCTGDLMRKCDQATILAGACDLAHGRLHDPSVYYQFDKTYFLYGICAALLKLSPDGVSSVAAANIGLALIFWSALTVFIVHFRKVLPPLVLLCFLTAPAVLLNTLYVNSSVLSSAFLLLSAVFLLKDGSRGGWPAALFFFLAGGTRADVILLLPLLIWLITPLPMIEKFLRGFSKDYKTGFKNITLFSKAWKLLLAGVLALAAGRIFFPVGGAAYDPIFNIKMVAGYTVFGLGAVGLLFALYSVRFAVQTARGRGVLEKFYGLAGLAAFLLPVLFFIPQLHTPRYFWRGCEAVFLLAVSGRLPARTRRPVNILVASAALLPLVLGVRLPALNQPQVAVAQPTLFPSGDGFYPMGGYIPFLIRLRNANENPVDHNQLVWSAVHSAQFDFLTDGTLKVLHTPMYGYFMLEASSRGGFARCLPFDRLGSGPFYADSRSLMRDDPKTPLNALPQILALPAHFVSPVSGGIGVLRFGEGSGQWGRQTRLLNRLFKGNEYRILAPDHRPADAKRAVCFSKNSFAGSEQDSDSGLYYTVGSGLSFPAEGWFAEPVLPGWMSLQAFGSGQ